VTAPFVTAPFVTAPFVTAPFVTAPFAHLIASEIVNMIEASGQIGVIATAR
jgi:SAM-dependent MidA family methyltransferase